MFKQISFETLNQMSVTKGELFKNVKITFDYALPQTWLDDFSDWCKAFKPLVTYHLILSTTVWAYKGFFDFPLTVCIDVHNAYLAYLKYKKWDSESYLNTLKSI